MDNVSRASCLSVFHLAAANPKQLESLGDKERKVVLEIANSIISGQDFPSVENMDMMEGITAKLASGASHVEKMEPPKIKFQAIRNFF